MKDDARSAAALRSPHFRHPLRSALPVVSVHGLLLISISDLQMLFCRPGTMIRSASHRIIW